MKGKWLIVNALVAIFSFNCSAATYRMVLVEYDGLSLVRKLEKRIEGNNGDEPCSFSWGDAEQAVLGLQWMECNKISIITKDEITVEIKLEKSAAEVNLGDKKVQRVKLHGSESVDRVALIENKLASRWYKEGMKGMEITVDIDLILDETVLLLNGKFEKVIRRDDGSFMTGRLEVASVRDWVK